MAILYKLFDFNRIVFYALAACFLLLMPLQAWASNPLFTIEDVEVDVTAANALEARDEAFNQAQQKAFKVLAERMLSEAEAQSFPVPDPSTISPMIQDYEITEEKLSSVRYIGTYTFRFKDNAVRRHFSHSELAYSDISSKPLLILPFYHHPEGLRIWSGPNPWMAAWNRNESKGALVPMTLPIGDLLDVKDIDDDEALNYDERRLQRMLDRYHAQEAVVAVAVPDENLQLVDGPDEAATGALTINIYRTDRAGPEHVQQLVVTAQPGQSFGQMMDTAVDEVRKALRRDWKKKTVTAASASGRIPVRVPFDNFQQWSSIQRTLQRIPGMNEVVLESLSPREAQVELIFQGDERRLRLALEQADLMLEAPQIQPASFYDRLSGQVRNTPYTLYQMRRQRGPAPYRNRF